jgi:hypothetical protein
MCLDGISPSLQYSLDYPLKYHLNNLKCIKTASFYIHLDSLFITQLWNSITLSNPEDGGKMFSEISVQVRTKWKKVPESI